MHFLHANPLHSFSSVTIFLHKTGRPVSFCGFPCVTNSLCFKRSCLLQCLCSIADISVPIIYKSPCHIDVVMWWCCDLRLHRLFTLIAQDRPHRSFAELKTLGDFDCSCACCRRVGSSGRYLTGDEHMTQRHHLLYCLDLLIIGFLAAAPT